MGTHVSIYQAVLCPAEGCDQCKQLADSLFHDGDYGTEPSCYTREIFHNFTVFTPLLRLQLLAGVVIHINMRKEDRSEKYRHIAQAFESLVPIMMEWAQHRDDFSFELQRIGAMAFDPGAPRHLPKWYKKRREEYVVSRIITDPELVSLFLTECLRQLDAPMRFILLQLQKKPAFWVYGNILLDDDFPLVGMRVEHGEIYRYTVYHQLKHAEESRFLPYRLLLAVDNGEFLQSIGFEHAFSTLHPDDLDCFLQAFDKKGEASIDDLTRIMVNRYFDFLKLDSIAYHDEVSLGDEYIEAIWETYPLPPGFDIDTIAGKWKTYRKGDAIAMVYDGPDHRLRQQPVPASLDDEFESDGWRFPEYRIAILFFDVERNRMAIFSNSEIGWHTMLHLITPVVSAPIDTLEAQHIVSLPVLGAIMQIPKAHLPWSDWRTRMPKRAWNLIEEIEHLSKTRAVFEESAQAEEFQLRFDLEARCKRLDVDISLISDTLDAVKATREQNLFEDGMFDITTVPGEYELHGLPPVSSLPLSDMVLPLEESRLFSVNALDAYPWFATLTNGSFVDGVDVDNLVDHVEDLFAVFFDEREMLGMLMMNYLFLLFLHTKEAWTPVRTFGIELLKLLYPYLKKIDDDDTDAFVSRLGDFVYTRLRTRALIEVKQRPTADQRFWGTYDIRPTRFFTTLVKKK